MSHPLPDVPSASRQIMAQNETQQAEVLGQTQHSRPANAGLPGIRSDHPDAQWFGNAPLGLFIHWGIASVDGEMDLSWGMIANMGEGKKMAPADYWDLAARFEPVNFNPREFLSAAAEAGFDYAVLTVKHHDGYTLWPSALTPFGVQKYLPGRDLVKEFVEAAREVGIRVGLFFSGMDWFFDQEFRSFNYRSQSGRGSSSLEPIADRVDFGINHEPRVPLPITAEFLARYAAFNRAQLIELLTNYGKIDVLWFDGGGGEGITIEEIRTLQPGIVVNNRGCVKEFSGTPADALGVFPGDFKTFECEERFPTTRPEGWWEENLIWNAPYWGYTQSNEEHYTPLSNLLALYLQAKAWGGAFLMNVGPRPDGSLPLPFFEGVSQIASWRKANRSALCGVEPQPVNLKANAPITVNGKCWYVFAIPGHGEMFELDLSGYGMTPALIAELGTGFPVKHEWDGARLIIKIAPRAPSSLPVAIEILWASSSESVTPEAILAKPQKCTSNAHHRIC